MSFNINSILMFVLVITNIRSYIIEHKIFLFYLISPIFFFGIAFATVYSGLFKPILTGNPYLDLFIYGIIFQVTLLISERIITSRRKDYTERCKIIAQGAAQHLKDGKIVECSFLMSELFRVLKNMRLRRINISIEQEPVSIKLPGMKEAIVFGKQKVFTYKPNLQELFQERLNILYEQRKAVSRAILATSSQSNPNFVSNIESLTNNLFCSDSAVDLTKAISSLDFFIEKGKDYNQETFSQKHKTIYSSIKGLTEAGKLLLIPLLTFILWLIFGYK
jgi:hypothetical protein